MAPSAPEESVEECFNTFQHKLQEYTVQPKARSDWIPQPFVLSAKLTEWLVATVDGRQDSNIAILLDAAHKDHINPPKAGDAKGGKKKCLLTFCILLELQQGHLLDCFLRSNIYDEKLPLPLNHLEEKVQGALEHSAPNITTHASAHDLAVRFDKVQWKYFPVKLGYGDENDWSRPYVFPFVDQQLITQKGGTAGVFEIAVPEAYVDKELMALSPTKAPHPDFPGLGPVFRFALKVFKDGHRHLWKQEIDAYKTLGDKKGMVHYLGNFSHAPDGKGSTYNILLEYAENDLAEYFHLSSPVLPSHIKDFWERLFRIASAIKEFHNFEMKRLRSKSTKIKGCHADIKPDNILLVQGEFKLADPGFAKFQKLQNDNQQAELAAQGGTTTYAAPELFSWSAQDVDPTKCDMWSLACVLSEAATWMVLGYTGTRQYSRLRRTAIKKSPRNIKETDPDELQSRRITGGDCFHDGISVLPEVLEWHKFLRSMLRPTDRVTNHVLDIIDIHLFRPTSQGRCDAEKLCKIWASQLKAINSNISIKLHQDIETTLEEAVGEEVNELSRTFQSLGIHDAGARRAIKSSTSFLQVLGPARAVLPPGRRLSAQDVDQDDPLRRAQMKAMVQRNRSISSAQHDITKPFSKQATRSMSLDSPSDKVTVFDSHYHHLAGGVYQNTLSSKVLSKLKGRKTSKDPSKDPRLVKDIVNRDLVFLVDNAESMQGFWSEARFVLENLVKSTWNIDSDGVELKFTTGPIEVQGKRDKIHDLQAFNFAMQHSDAAPTPKTVTDMSIKLQQILFSWLQKYKLARKCGQTPKFMTVIVLTDGVWDGMRSNPFAVDQVIIEFHQHLTRACDGWPPKRALSIEFISFGNDLNALHRLKRLDEDLGVEGVPDIVDTEPSTGDVYQMLLGSIMDEYDNRNDYLLEETTSPSEMDDPLQNTLIAATSVQRSPESRPLGHQNAAGMTQSVRRQPSAASDAAAALSKTISNATPTFETTQH